MRDEPTEMIDSNAFTPKTSRELSDALGIATRYNERQLSDPSFGYVVADFVCSEIEHQNMTRTNRGQVSVAHGRKFPDGSLHLFVPDPSVAWRRTLVDRKVRNKNWPVDQIFVAFELDQIPTDVPTILRCPKHGERSVANQLILDAITKGTPMHRRVLRV